MATQCHSLRAHSLNGNPDVPPVCSLPRHVTLISLPPGPVTTMRVCTAFPSTGSRGPEIAELNWGQRLTIWWVRPAHGRLTKPSLGERSRGPGSPCQPGAPRGHARVVTVSPPEFFLVALPPEVAGCPFLPWERSRWSSWVTNGVVPLAVGEHCPTPRWPEPRGRRGQDGSGKLGER